MATESILESETGIFEEIRNRSKINEKQIDAILDGRIHRRESWILSVIAQNGNCTIEHIKKMFKRHSKHIDDWALEEIVTYRKDIDMFFEEILHNYRGIASSSVLNSIARDPNCTTEMLQTILSYPSEKITSRVLNAIIRNENCVLPLLDRIERLHKDKLNSLSLVLIIENKNSNLWLLERIMKKDLSKDIGVLSALAKNKLVQYELLENLLDKYPYSIDSDFVWRIVNDKKFTREVLEKIVDNHYRMINSMILGKIVSTSFLDFTLLDRLLERIRRSEPWHFEGKVWQR